MDQTISQLRAQDLPFAITQAVASRESFPLLSLMSVKGMDSLFHPPCSHPLCLQLLSWRLHQVPLRYRASSPYSCMSLSSKDTAGAQLQSWESHEAGMLTHTLNTISSVTGDVNKTASKSQRGDLSWLEENPCWGRAVSGNAEPVVAGSCLAAAGTALWHLSVSASAPSHTSDCPKDAREQESVWKAGLKLCSLPPCPAKRGRGWPELAVSVHLIKAINLCGELWMALLTINQIKRTREIRIWSSK